MEFNLDLFVDYPISTNSMSGGKFKPKPKLKSKTSAPLSTPLAVPSVPMENVKTQALISSHSANSLQDFNAVQGNPVIPCKDESINSGCLDTTPQAVVNSNGGLYSDPGKNSAELFKLLPESAVNNGLCAGATQSGLHDPDLLSIHTSDILTKKPIKKDGESFSNMMPSANEMIGNPLKVQFIGLPESDENVHYSIPNEKAGSPSFDTGKGSVEKKREGLVIKFPDSNMRNSESEREFSRPLEANMDMVSTDCLHLDVENSDDSGDSKDTLGKLTGHKTNIFFGQDSLDDFLPQSTSQIVDNDRDLRPQVDENANSGKEILTTLDSNLFKASPRIPIHNQPDQEIGISVASSINSPSLVVDNGYLNTELQSGEAYPSLVSQKIISDSTVASGSRIAKIPPRRKITRKNGNSFTHIPAPGAGEPSLQEISQRFDDPVPTIPAFNDELQNPVDISISQDSVPEDVNIGTVSGMNGVMGSKRSKRKGVATYKLDENDTHESGDFFVENHGRSVIDEGVDNDDEYRASTSSHKKQAQQRKSKKSVAESKKRGRKHKNAAEEVQEEPINEAPKKFSHSTKRNRRRQVDKALLEIPEDELDRQNIPLKDLILLAEYNEQSASKEAATLRTSINQRSGDHVSENEPYSEGGAYNVSDFGSEQAKTSGGEENMKVQEATGFFNYQTYMNKLPKSRWLKKDTELFYEALRQFGADISMIQQLFPDRARRQVLLKFKKEERQNPSKLDDALKNRTQDFSYFQKVIERLQQATTPKKVSKKEDSNSMQNDEIGATEAVGSPTTTVQKEEDMGIGNGEAGEVQESQIDDNDDDDEFLRWSEYKSDDV